MTTTLQLSEELSAGPARLRIDVFGDEPRAHVLDDMSFLNYRLADVRICAGGHPRPSPTSSGTRRGPRRSLTTGGR